MTGFDVDRSANGQKPADNNACTGFYHSDSIRVQKSFFLDDDLFEIARDLDQHPMVQYPLTAFLSKDNTSNLANVINKSWNHLAASCAHLTSHRVHLCVSRVIFRPARPKDKVIINFMRGRIFDEDWKHLHGYELKWQDRSIVFPRIFDVGTAFVPGGQTFGPEDPRIIVEDFAGAEPVIVFNMAMPDIGWHRAMFIHRPFTNQTTMLTINGIGRKKKEKNWTPLFLKNIDGSHNTFIHFVWRFGPLAVLKCSLSNGLCDIVFDQNISKELLSQFSFKGASIRGGTQFVPIPCLNRGTSECRSDIQAFVSFPRHHVEHVGDLEIVNKPGYRPEAAILLTNGSHFYFSYFSAPLDFGADMVMQASALNDAGLYGRIMIANSIVSWNIDELPTFGATTSDTLTTGTPSKNDVMTLTLSVNDDTVQVMRIAGLYQYIRKLPSMAGFFGYSDATSSSLGQNIFGNFHDDVWFERTSLAAWSIRSCAENAAKDYTLRHSKSWIENSKE